MSVAEPCGLSDASTPSDDDVAVLRSLAEGTARHPGQSFFESLVRHLAQATNTRQGFVAELVGPTRVRTLARWVGDRIADNLDREVIATPCLAVLRGNLSHHESAVKATFPKDKQLAEWGIESYLGVPLLDSKGQIIGQLTVLDDRLMPANARRVLIVRIFAARAEAELERMRQERKDASAPSPAPDKPREPVPNHLVEVERRHILNVLAQTNWVIDGPDGAAKLLHLTPDTLRSRMVKLGISQNPPTSERMKDE